MSNLASQLIELRDRKIVCVRMNISLILFPPIVKSS